MGDTIGYGIIGSGMMGGEHIFDLNHIDGAEVVALADPVATSIEWGLGCVEAGPGGADAKARVATYADHLDLLADPNVDVVVITTPNFTHAAVLADALATDKHVLIEKPLCTTVDDCRAVVDAADRRDADHLDGAAVPLHADTPRRCSASSRPVSAARPAWCRSASTGSRS